MKVTVRFGAQARTAAGAASESVEIAGSTVRDLLADLAGRHGEPLRGILLHPSTLVFVGDEQAGPERALRDGQEVSILTPISGG